MDGIKDTNLQQFFCRGSITGRFGKAGIHKAPEVVSPLSTR